MGHIISSSSPRMADMSQTTEGGFIKGSRASDLFCKIEINGTVVTASKTEDHTEYESIPNMIVLRQSNQSNPNATQDQVSSSRTLFQDVEVILPTGGAAVNCRVACVKGELAKVHFKRLVNDGEERKVAIEYTLSNSKIVAVDDETTEDGRPMTKITFSVEKVVQIVHGAEGGEFNFTYSVANNKLD